MTLGAGLTPDGLPLTLLGIPRAGGVRCGSASHPTPLSLAAAVAPTAGRTAGALSPPICRTAFSRLTAVLCAQRTPPGGGLPP